MVNTAFRSVILMWFLLDGKQRRSDESKVKTCLWKFVRSKSRDNVISATHKHDRPVYWDASDADIATTG